MTKSILLVLYRVLNMTMADFTQHYEHVHIPLIQNISGSAFPTRHIRHYVARDPDGPAVAGADRNAKAPAIVLQGNVSHMDWDCLTEMDFRDDAHYQAFFAAIGQGDGATRREADEKKFLDVNLTTTLQQGQVFITTNPAC